MQESPWPAERVQDALKQAHDGDHHFADSSILGSMCTEPHDLARMAHNLFAETNLGDPDHFPGAARMELEVIHDLLQLLHAPEGAEGRFLTGGTEANLFALYIAREATGKRQVVVPEHAHFSFEKAARMLGMELVWVPDRPDHRCNVDAMAAAITEDTALVVGVAGTTELGLVDPLVDLSVACSEKGVRLHVDGAFGGYVLPFLEGAAPFHFAIPGVWSVSMDPHKMGRSVIPAGVLLVRDGTEWQHVAVATPYVSTDKQTQLLGTRPGAAAAATWAVHRALGREGYQRQTKECMDVRDHLVRGLKDAGYELIAEPELNVVTFRVEDPMAVSDALTKQGVRVNVIPRFSAIRIVVGPHVTPYAVDRLLSHLPESVQHAS